MTCRYFSCGSGGTGLLWTGDKEDYNQFQESKIPTDIKDLKISGVIGIALDTQNNAFYWSEMNSILLRNDVSRIACGWSHVLFISEECVYTYGQGSFGQLGLGSRKLVEIPEKLDLESCVNISCGFRTSFVITKNGTFCFGENRKHQLGLPINRNISEPILNEKLNFPIKIEAGNKHGVGLSNGQVFVWGQNNYGQLGLRVAEIYEPIRVEINREIINISCGWYHSLILTNENELFISGRGDLGQQGTGRYENNYEFTKILENVDDFAAGTEHSLAIRDNKLYSWGWNEHGNLGISTNTNNASISEIHIPNPTKVVCGGAISYVICDNVLNLQ